MSSPRFSHTINRAEHTIIVERLGVSVTFYPQDKDRTLTSLLLKLREYGDDVTGDDPVSKTERRSLDMQLTSIYEEWEKEIATRKVTLPERLAAQVNARIVDKWMDHEGRHYAAMDRDNHIHTLEMDSEEFGKVVSNIAYDDIKKGIVTNSDRDLAIRHLKDRTSKRKRMYNRVAMIDRTIYYDLHRDNWQAIEITGKGWSIKENPRILRRDVNDPTLYATPIPNREYDKNRHYVRELISTMAIKYEHQRRILEILPFSYYVPDIAHPVLVPFGPAGSGKSTLLRVIRMLIDPMNDSDGLVAAIPKDPKDRRVNIVGNYLTFWDQISSLTHDEMDEICRWTTGTSETVRVLHTTDERRVYVGKRIIGLSGINIPISQSDAMNRSFIVEMANIDRLSGNISEHRSGFSGRTDSQRMAHVRSILPDVYGYMMDRLVKTLEIYEAEASNIVPNHRLDDFVVWGECISRALGYPPGQFLKDWELNIQTQKFAVIENNSFASLFVRYAFNSHKEERFVLGPLEMYNELVTFAGSIGVDYYAEKSMPKGESWFSRRLAEIQHDLSIVGINVDSDRSTGVRRIIVTKDLKLHRQYIEESVKRDQAEQKERDEAIKEAEEKDKNEAMHLFRRYCNERNVRRALPQMFQTYLTSSTHDTGRSHYLIGRLVQEGRLAYDDENNLVLGPKGEREPEVQG